MVDLKLFSAFIIFVISICLAVQAQSNSAQVAINEHNKYRKAQGSSNMKMMIWDEQIAQEAADYAAECNFAYDPDRGSVGENIYLTKDLGVENIAEKAILSWYNEIDNYDFESFTCSGVCSHYTQVVWANSYKLGCGAASCPSGVKNGFNQGTIYICRYGPPGNYVGQDPFVVGDACSECDEGWENCVDGLCARDDMTTTTTTTSTTTTTATTTTDFSTGTEPNTISTSTNEPEPDSTSPPHSTSSSGTIYTSTTPGSQPTMEPEPHCPTEHPDKPDQGCSGCDRYEKALDDYEEKLRDWEVNYEAWKEKYHRCG